MKRTSDKTSKSSTDVTLPPQACCSEASGGRRLSLPEISRDCEHQGQFDALTIGDEILFALDNADPKLAATLLRKAPRLQQPYLASLADMLDGDPKTDPSVAKRFTYRLRLAPWGIRGRKAKGSRAQPFTPLRKKSKPHPTDAMLCSMVIRKMEADPLLSRADAVAEVATANSVSTSLVEKAYDKDRGKLRRSSSLMGAR